MRNPFYLIFFGITCTTLLTGCNTMVGLGKDVKKGGASLEQTAREEQQKPYTVKQRYHCPPATKRVGHYYPPNRFYNPTRTEYID